MLDRAVDMSRDPTKPRIKLLRTVLSHTESMALYRKAHAVVLPVRAEGFGLVAIEAMSFGLPVIATEGTMSDFCNQATCFLVESKKVPCAIDPCGDGTVFGMKTPTQPTWFEPSVVSLSKWMKYVVKNREKAKRRGRLARIYVNQFWQWKKAQKMVLQRMNKLS